MTRFHMGPVLWEFSGLAEYLSVFPPERGHLVLTHRFLFSSRLEGLAAPWTVLLYEDYGAGEPTDAMVDAMLADTRRLDIRRVIGIGGGSVLDVAKLLCVKGAATTEDIFEDRIPPVRDKELILIPTTCGTGCEMTCVSVLDYSRVGAKVGKRIEANYADHAVLIPELLAGLPEEPFLFSSVDALIHAVEIFLAPTASPFSRVYCAEAIRIIVARYADLAEKGLGSRGDSLRDFLRASSCAGIALANTVCGAVHALAMHFGSAYHVAHGEANYRFLFPVLERYAVLAPDGEIRALSEIVAASIGAPASEALSALRSLLEGLFPARAFRDYGVAEAHIPHNVDRVLESQQRLLVNSHVPLDRGDLLCIYETAWKYSENGR